jgi:hypothetical protein
MNLYQYLIELGIGTASGVLSSAVNSLITKDFFAKNELMSAISSLHIENAELKAESIIKFLAENGNIKIIGTNVYSGKSIEMKSEKNTHFIFGNNSVSSTPNSKIEAGKDAYIKGSGGASIKQDEDGSISFYT